MQIIISECEKNSDILKINIMPGQNRRSSRLKRGIKQPILSSCEINKMNTCVIKTLVKSLDSIMEHEIYWHVLWKK